MTNNLMTLVGSLPLYAAMLMRNVTMKLVWGAQACTDGKTFISLPKTLIRDANFIIKAFGYLLHEIGHNLFTDMDQYAKAKDGLWSEMTNVIEDPRMEKQLYTKFRGAMARLTELVRVLVQDGDFGPPSPEDSPADLLCTYCLYQLRSQYLGQTGLSEYALQAEQLMKGAFPKGAMIRLKVLLNEIDSLDDAAGSVQLAKKIIKMIDEEIQKEDKENQKKESSQPDAQPGQDDGQSDSSGPTKDAKAKSGKGTDNNQTPDSNDKGSSDTKSGKSDSQDGNSKEAPSSTGSGGAGKHEDKPSVFQDTLDSLSDGPERNYDVGKRLEASMNDDSAKAEKKLKKEGVNGEIEDFSGSHKDHSTGRDGDLEQNAMGQTNVMRARLRTMLQAHTETHSQKATNGDLDTHALHKLIIGDPKIFLKYDDEIELNTDLVILADTSYSIGDDDVLVSQSCYAIAAACDSIPGINVSVFIFPGYSGMIDCIKQYGERADRCSSRFDFRHHGGTPMCQAIMAGALALEQGQGTRKLMITITDGQPVNPEYTKYLIDDCTTAGIEMLGLGIGADQNVDSFFPVHSEVESFDQLSAALFGMLQGRLLHAA